MEKGNIVTPTKMWGSNKVDIVKAIVLEVYKDRTLTEYKIQDLDNKNILIVYDYEVE